MPSDCVLYFLFDLIPHKSDKNRFLFSFIAEECVWSHLVIHIENKVSFEMGDNVHAVFVFID